MTAEIAKITAICSAIILLFGIVAERFPTIKADSQVVCLEELQDTDVFPLLLDGDNDKDALSTISRDVHWANFSSKLRIWQHNLEDLLNPSYGPRYLRGPPCV